MAIEKVTPRTERELTPGFNRFTDVLDRFFDDAFRSAPWALEGFSPQVDVSETESHYIYEVALPGMKKEDISINVDDNLLTISGEKKHEDEKEKEDRYHLVENYYGSFSRSFTLPGNINQDNIEATYEDGILKISVEKENKGSGKEIEVK